ncbi:MAG TPA: acetylornithine deacetylase [Rhizomicrobium sp.]|nr:acetylornithine deacetylase [Rhizomicrobium sp.]
MTVSPHALVERLVAFDTTSRGSNLALIDHAQELLEKAGARCRRTYDGTRAKANLFASLGPGEEGGYVLSGHTDVVPVDGQDWSSDPFRPEVRGGKMFGRGTADMKGFIGTALSLLPLIAGAKLKRPIHFALSYDEEVGCAGVGALIEDLKAAAIRPAMVLVGEPTEMKIVGAHKGGSVIQTHCRGLEGHSSAPDKGANAVMMAGEFVAYLKALGDSLKHHRDAHFDPPYTTVQANMISGGTAVNVLARDATVTWEYRNLPDRDGAAIVDAARHHADHEIVPRYRRAAPDARIDIVVKTNYPGLALDPDSPAIALARELSGANSVETVAYGTEAGLFQRAGIPAVICGPGSIDQAHKADEFVALSQLAACEGFLKKLIARACA